MRVYHRAATAAPFAANVVTGAHGQAATPNVASTRRPEATAATLGAPTFAHVAPAPPATTGVAAAAVWRAAKS